MAKCFRGGMKTFLPSLVGALLLAITARAEDVQSVSTGKILVLGAGFGPKPEIGEPVPDSFYGTLCEIAMGTQLQEHAAVRVHSLHPNLTPHAVKIQATRSPNTSLVVVSVTSPDEAYAQAMTDAVMDELFATWTEIKGDRYEAQAVSIQDEMVRVEKNMQHAEEELQEAERAKAEPSDLDKVKAKLKRVNNRYEALLSMMCAVEDARILSPKTFMVIEHALKPKKVEKAP